MNRSKHRGFVLGGLVAAIAAVTVLAAVERAVEPSFDRFCVGASSTASNGEQPPRMVSDMKRWICVSVSPGEAPENHYAGY